MGYGYVAAGILAFLMYAAAVAWFRSVPSYSGRMLVTYAVALVVVGGGFAELALRGTLPPKAAAGVGTLLVMATIALAFSEYRQVVVLAFGLATSTLCLLNTCVVHFTLPGVVLRSLVGSAERTVSRGERLVSHQSEQLEVQAGRAKLLVLLYALNVLSLIAAACWLEVSLPRMWIPQVVLGFATSAAGALAHGKLAEAAAGFEQCSETGLDRRG